MKQIKGGEVDRATTLFFLFVLMQIAQAIANL